VDGDKAKVAEVSKEADWVMMYNAERQPVALLHRDGIGCAAYIRSLNGSAAILARSSLAAVHKCQLHEVMIRDAEARIGQYILDGGDSANSYDSYVEGQKRKVLKWQRVIKGLFPATPAGQEGAADGS